MFLHAITCTKSSQNNNQKYTPEWYKNIIIFASYFSRHNFFFFYILYSHSFRDTKMSGNCKNIMNSIHLNRIHDRYLRSITLKYLRGVSIYSSMHLPISFYFLLFLLFVFIVMFFIALYTKIPDIWKTKITILSIIKTQTFSTFSVCQTQNMEKRKVLST